MNKQVQTNETVFHIQAIQLKESEKEIKEAKMKTIPQVLTLTSLKEKLKGYTLLMRNPGTNEFSVECRRLIVDLFGSQISSNQLGNVLEKIFARRLGMILTKKETPSPRTSDNIR